MKRFFGMKKKKKEKNDADLFYEPPSVTDRHVNSSSNYRGNDNAGSNTNHATNSNTIINPLPSPPPVASDTGSDHPSSSTPSHAALARYRYALDAYADTISPAFSNEDGMGGGGGTLRSRGGRSAGLTHRSLIPTFLEHSQYHHHQQHDTAGNAAASPEEIAPNFESYKNVSSRGGVGDKYIYNEAYERLMRGGGPTNEPEKEKWAPIPEEPRDGRESSNDSQNNNGSQISEKSSRYEVSPSSSEGPGNSDHDVINATQQLNQQHRFQSHQLQNEPNHDIPTQSLHSSTQQHLHATALDSDQTTGEPIHSTTKQPSVQRLNNINFRDNPHTPHNLNRAGNASTSPQYSQYTMNSCETLDTHHTPQSGTHFQPNPNINPPSSSINHSNPAALLLHPDAIYDEYYGDAYVDGLITYLYPSGYQSMRPRSGPWKLSIFIFLLFLWLSVFIVGHCYDRGQREYNYYFGNDDDAYLEEVDDDALVMETRWCGSKVLYFMWILSVSITILAMSYCSIIGYVKVRDVAVANGRSRPPGMENSAGRSDYVMIENVAKGGTNTSSDIASSVSLEYSSYQGGGTSSRYVPSIYQSDGTPQFWGGHIYRPTQAAVAMTNR